MDWIGSGITLKKNGKEVSEEPVKGEFVKFVHNEWPRNEDQNEEESDWDEEEENIAMELFLIEYNERQTHLPMRNKAMIHQVWYKTNKETPIKAVPPAHKKMIGP